MILLRTQPPDAFGGPLEVAEAYLRAGRPQRAREALASVANADETDTRLRLLRGEAQLALGLYTEAATTLATIPHASLLHQRALAGLRLALEAQGLSALAQEVR